MTEGGVREVFVVLTKARDYGIVQVSIDGNKLGEPIDCYDPTVTTTGEISLGTLELKPGKHILRATLTGANDQSKNAVGVGRHLFGLDYLRLQTPPSLPPAGDPKSEPSAASGNTGRPNILFCIADDWGYHFSGQGEKKPKTPTFDRIAAEGMLFENAHAAAPSCTPSRNAILTGAHPWKLGRGANLFSRFPEGFVTYPNLLKDSGYHVGSNGKDFGPGKVPEGMPHPCVKSYGWPQNPGTFRKFLKERQPGQPFCYWFGSTDPHRGYDRQLTRKLGVGPEDVEVPPTFPDVEAVRWDIADYYAEVQRFDTEVGQVVDILKENGLLENTLIVVTSDHGWPFPRGKCNLYDSGTHVPLAVMWKGRMRGGQTVADFVNLVENATAESP
jgi:arylsulfatase A-like enzyme